MKLKLLQESPKTCALTFDKGEVLALVGDITLDQGQPKVHARIIVGKADGVAHGGNLPEARVWPTLELILVESPAHLRRETDTETGLALIRL